MNSIMPSLINEAYRLAKDRLRRVCPLHTTLCSPPIFVGHQRIQTFRHH